MRNQRQNYAGRLYWRPGQTRVWSNDGRFFDLGNHSLESCRRVAAQLGYLLIVQGSPALTHETSR